MWVYVNPLQAFERSIGTRETILLVYILCILIYYIFFEMIFGITPAKYLTATRVANEFGNKPNFGTLIGRTLSRLIPFDAVSFLFTRGWHDSISDTYVLNDGVAKAAFSFEEKQTAR
jgi:uncharacterized RDD family membrane protein YckC